MKFFRNTAVSTLFVAAITAQAQQYKLNDPNGTNAVLNTEENYSRMIIGQDQPNNGLEITTGGRANVGSLVDVGQFETATNSSLTVKNGGMLVIGAADTNNLPASGITVGDSSGTGELRVSNDSTIETDNLVVGAGENETGSVLASSGSRIIVSDDLMIGTTNNANNQVTIGNDSALTISDTANLKISNKDGASDNLNSLNIQSGGSLLVKGDVDASALSSSEGVNFSSGATLGVGGTLTAKDNSINNSISVLIDDALSTNHTAQWHADYIDIGRDTDNNSLIIQNGAKASSTNEILIGTYGANNALTVEGTNSTLTALDRVFIGGDGNNNKLEILDGAEADISGNVAIGVSSTGNDLLVNGTNSSLTIGGDVYVGGNDGSNNLELEDGATADFQSDVYVGENGSNNRLTLSDADATVSGTFIIGNKEGASGNTGSVNQQNPPSTTGNMAMVGTNSTLTLNNGLTVGNEGSGSILNIYDGGNVDVTGDVVIGENVGDNYIYLQRDSNTQFNVTGDLIVGKSEEGSNRFAVYGGTADIGGDLLLGASTNQHDIKNFIHLETTNAVLNVAGAIEIGSSNSLNTFEIVDGASASASTLLVGVYEGSSNNTVTVRGDDALLDIDGIVQIGSTNSGGNTITLQDGGMLNVAQTNIVIGSTNDFLNVADGGILKTLGWDFDAQTNLATNIVFESGSTLHLLGLLEGTNMVDGGRTYLLDGAGASWDTTTNNLYVGNTADNNALTITNGASASTSTNLYIGFESGYNTLSVGSTGSTLNVGADLYIGTDNDSSGRNALEVLNGAMVSVGGDAYLNTFANLKIDSKSQVNVAGNFTQDDTSTLEVGISSNQVNPNLVVGGTAEFASRNATEDTTLIRVFNEGIEESNVVTIVQAGAITVDGKDATGTQIESNIESNSLLGFSVLVTNDASYAYIILSDFLERKIGDVGNLSGQTLDVSIEIEDMKAAGNAVASNMVNFTSTLSGDEINATYNNLYHEKISSVPAHNVINLGIQSVNEQLFMRADTTRSRVGLASATSSTVGPAGPHAADQELQGWISGYGSWADKGATSGYTGYDSSLSGFMVGADMSVSENVLIGLAGGTGNGDVDKDNGSSADTKSIYAALYSSIGTESWFGDFSLIYANNDVNSTIDPTFQTQAEYNAQNVAFSIGGGKEFVGNYLILTPQLSFLGNYYTQEEYAETSANAVTREVEEFNAFYLQSALGGSASLYSSVGSVTFKPEIRLHWLHEWLGEEEKLNYRLTGGANNYSLLLQAPEKDIFKIGIGSSAKFGEYLELRADLDTRFGKDYSDYTLLGSLRYQF